MNRPISRGRFALGAAALLAAVAAGYAPLPAAAYENLGRLFFTPQQRQDLDRRRQANIQESAVTAESLVTVNGQVSRSSGKTTTWLNGVPQESNRHLRDPARVTLPGGENESSVTLKIGQTLDKIRGEVKDPVGSGRIMVPPENRSHAP
jgi:hypothetical protein